jgi:hypothetical protein
LDVIETKNLGHLLHSIHSHLQQRILLPTMVFLDLRFLQQQLKVGFGFVYIISLFTLESNFVLSLVTLYLFIKNIFSFRNNN